MASVGKVYDVVIAGAGPVGLFLACELALARVSVLVLEKDSDPRSPWKTPHLGGRGLNTAAMEALHRRGLLEAVTNPDGTPQLATKPGAPPFGGHFAGMLLSTKDLDLSRSRWRLPGPALFPARTHMQRIEDVLADRASSSGVAIRRGEGLSRVENETRHGIEMTTTRGARLRSRWLVGCDGGKSTVRKEAGIAFRGTDARMTGYMMQCTVDHPERLKPGFHCADNGLWISARGSIIGMMDPDGATYDRSQEPTRHHLQSVFERVSGVKDVKITQVDYVGTYTDACRQAALYRKGRILLAGDSAHIHSPMGAQGLTTGIGDAMNLGWKLAAAIRREKSEVSADELSSTSSSTSMQNALLDTYEEERHPEGARALEWTRAQVLALEPGSFGKAMRNLLTDVFATKEGTNLMLDKLWGLNQRYQLEGHGSGHPLIGRSVPDFELPDGTRLGDHMHHGKGMLVALKASVVTAWLGEGYEDRLESLRIAPTETLGIDALLVRPDGVVVWVMEEGAEPDLDAFKEAFEKWFGF